MKSKFIVEHIPTGKTWEGLTTELDEGEVENEAAFCKGIVKSGTWMSVNIIPVSGESKVYIPENILKDCVIYHNTNS